MESFGKARRLIGYVLVAGLLAVTGWAAYVHFHSPIVRALTRHADDPVYVAILTKPGMALVYNPQTRKAVVTTAKRRKLPDDPSENAQDLFQITGLQPTDLRYYIPRTLERDVYWDNLKDNLSTWRFNPLLTGQIVWEYLRALYEKRTNLHPAEFLLYALDMTLLEITDFTVRNLEDTKKKRNNKTATSVPPAAPAVPTATEDSILPLGEDRAPLAKDDRPLVIEILNASGQKGAALKLTQYLRDKSQKGLLRVDVLQYDNYRLEQTQIIDFTGRRALLKQLSTAIGVNNEIVSEKQDTAICDARVLIGEDFKLPL